MMFSGREIMAAQIGIVKALIGTATATAADGTIRNLQIGDQVFADELITTGVGGAIELEFADGSVMDLGRNSQALLDDTVFSPEAATVVADAIDADVAAIQAALLAGEDPIQAGEATAAGAGVTDGNEGHQPIIVDYLAPEAPVESGFDTTGIGTVFPEIDEELLPEEPPVVSISVALNVVDPVTGDPIILPELPTEEFPITVSGNTVNLIEGTSDGGVREITFELQLSKAFNDDVTVTYQFTEGTAEHLVDWFDGELINTVVIPAGQTTFPVTVYIAEDHLVEATENFGIEIIEAINATIDPTNNTATVNIIDDDVPPEAFNDAYATEEATPITIAAGSGILSNDTGADSGEVLTVTSYSQPANGTVVLNEDGSFTYTPNPEFNGQDTFVYSMTDGYNGESSATVTIDVDANPDAVNDAFTTDQGVAITGTVVTNDDRGDDPATFGNISSPANGSLVFNDDGTFTYTPNEGFSGSDSFQYEITDADGDTDVATVNLTVVPEPVQPPQPPQPGIPAISISDAVAVVEPDSDSVSAPLPQGDFGIVEYSTDQTTTGAYAVFTVTLSEAADENVTVNFSTEDGTAVITGTQANGELDYVETSGTITFAPGQTTAYIQVPVNDDYIAEGTESFTVELSDLSSNAVFSDASGLGAIVDESEPTAEDTITLELFAVTGYEDDGTPITDDANSVHEGVSPEYIVKAYDPEGNEITVTGNVQISFEDISTDGISDYNNATKSVPVGVVFSTTTVSDTIDPIITVDNENNTISITPEQYFENPEDFEVNLVIDSYTNADKYENVDYIDGVITTITDSFNTPPDYGLDPDTTDPSTSGASLTVYENELAGGNDPEGDTDDESTIATGTVRFVPGSETTYPTNEYPDNDTSGNTEYDQIAGSSIVFGATTNIVVSDDGGNPALSDLEEAYTIEWSGVGTTTLTGSIEGYGDVIKLTLTNAQDSSGAAAATAVITAELLDAMPHQNDVDVSQLTISGISVVAGSLSTSVSVTVVDDVPVVTALDAIIENKLGDLSGLLDYSLGGDGLGLVDITSVNVSHAGSAYSLKSGGENVLFDIQDSNGDNVEEIYGYINTDGEAGYNSETDTLVMSMTPNDVESGDYTLELHQLLDMPTGTPTTLDFGDILAGSPVGFKVVTDGLDTPTAKLLVTAIAGDDNNGNGLEVNANQGFLGIEDTQMDGDGPTVVGKNGQDTGTGTEEVIQFQFGEINTSEGTIITPEIVNDVSFHVFDTGSGDDTYSWIALRGGVQVGSGQESVDPANGNAGDDLPVISVNGGFDTVIFTMENGSFKMGGVSYNEAGAQESLDIAIGYSVTDADSDGASGTFNITVMPDNTDNILDNTLIQPDNTN
jgi:hypothetical protein